MDYRDFIDKSEQIKLEILKQLLFSPNHCTKKELQKKLDLTSQTLTLYLDELVYEIEKKMNFKAYIIDEQSNIKFIKDDHITLLDFMNYYLRNSYKYKIMNFIFENGSFTYLALEQYLIVSRSTVYRKLTELNQSLAEFELEIYNGELKGPELQIRYFFYQMFTQLHSFEIISSFMTNKTILNVINGLETSLFSNFTQTSKSKMYMWMHVVFKRYTITKKFEFKDKYDLTRVMQNAKFYQKIKILLKDIEKLQNFKRHETDRVYMYVASYCFSFFPDFFQDYLQWDRQYLQACIPLNETYSLIQDFMMEKFSINDLSKNEYDKIQFLLMQSILQCMLFSGYIFSYDEDQFNTSIKSQPNDLFVKKASEFIEKLFMIWNISQFESNDSLHRNLRYHISGIFRYIEFIGEKPIKIGLRIHGELLIQLLSEQAWARYLNGEIKTEVKIYDKSENYDLVISDYRTSEDVSLKNTYLLSGLNSEYDIEKIVDLIKKIRLSEQDIIS